MQEEISLREIMLTIWGGKWIVVISTITAAILAGVISFYILSPTYEAQTTIRIGNGSVSDEQGNNLYALAESLKTDVAMKRVIDKLNLDNEDYSINSIRNSINVEIVKDTSVMKLKVTGQDPSAITNIANIMAFELGARIEISDRSQWIVDSKKRIGELDNLIAISKQAIEEANKQLDQNPEKLITKQALAEEPYLQSVLKESSSISNIALGAVQLETETINPVFSILKETIAVTAIDLVRMVSEKQNLQAEILTNESKINELEQQIVKEKLRAITSERLLDGFNAVFISPAIEPIVPIGPKKVQNIALAAIVGFILSLIAVFLRSYLKGSDVVRTNTLVV